MNRLLLLVGASLVCFLGCGSADSDAVGGEPDDDLAEVSDTAAKADSTSGPVGTFRNEGSGGNFELLVLKNDMTFYGEDDSHDRYDGRFKFTRAGSTKYVSLFWSDGAFFRKYAYKLKGETLSLRQTKKSAWFDLKLTKDKSWCAVENDCASQGLVCQGIWTCNHTGIVGYAEDLCSCGTSAPSSECDKAARDAVAVLEKINGWTGEVAKSELVDAFSDSELIRITLNRPENVTSKLLVNTESMGGSPCYVYGLQYVEHQIDMRDDGKNADTTNEPSEECKKVAIQAAMDLENANGWEQSAVTRAQLVDGFSDHELIRLQTQDAGEKKDSYLVNTESMGGSPCYVYGIQLKSEEMELQDK